MSNILSKFLRFLGCVLLGAAVSVYIVTENIVLKQEAASQHFLKTASDEGASSLAIEVGLGVTKRVILAADERAAVVASILIFAFGLILIFLGVYISERSKVDRCDSR